MQLLLSVSKAQKRFIVILAVVVRMHPAVGVARYEYFYRIYSRAGRFFNSVGLSFPAVPIVNAYCYD